MSLRSADIAASLATSAASVEATVVRLGQAATNAAHGSLFWHMPGVGLSLVHHEVDGIEVTLPPPSRALAKGKAGIAQWVFERGEAHLCPHAEADPLYTRYILDVGSMVAVPIWQHKKVVGVLAVAARQPSAFDRAHVAMLQQVADASGQALRRALLDRQSREQTGRPFLIRGLSQAWREVERRIDLAAPTNAPILVQGESGTGKDLVARAIHANSQRALAPYVTVNCAAIPDTLLESILFGHVKGAFTGAATVKIGEFEKANGGTLFLDEVGEIPLPLQAKILRAIEQGEIQPLGSNDTAKRVDVRLVAATNRNLPSMVRAGTFRDDLYYRLSVMTLELPPLRAYKDNIEVLAAVFVEQAARAQGKPAPRITASALAALRAHEFPGNVRELRNAMEHAMILAGSGDITAAELPKPIATGASAAASQGGGAEPNASGSPASAPLTRRLATAPSVPSVTAPPWGTSVGDLTLEHIRANYLDPLERAYLLALLDAMDGNVRKAARAANVAPLTFYRLLSRHGIHRKRVAE